MVCSTKNDKRPLLGGLLVAFCTLEGGHALVAPPLLSTRLQHHRSSGNGAIKPTDPTLPFNLNSGVIHHNCIGQQHQSSNCVFHSASVRRDNVALRSSSSDVDVDDERSATLSLLTLAEWNTQFDD